MWLGEYYENLLPNESYKPFAALTRKSSELLPQSGYPQRP